MATLKTLLLPALLALAPACDGLREFTITHPDELLSQADRSLATVLLVTWEADATPGMDVVFRLEGVSPEGVRHESERFPVDDGNAYWIIGDPTAVGLYRLHADATMAASGWSRSRTARSSCPASSSARRPTTSPARRRTGTCGSRARRSVRCSSASRSTTTPVDRSARLE
jgi:hypothetical protein